MKKIPARNWISMIIVIAVILWSFYRVISHFIAINTVQGTIILVAGMFLLGSFLLYFAIQKFK